MEYCNERGRQLSLQQFNCQRLINRLLKLNLLVNDKSTHKIPDKTWVFFTYLCIMNSLRVKYSQYNHFFILQLARALHLNIPVTVIQCMY